MRAHYRRHNKQTRARDLRPRASRGHMRSRGIKLIIRLVVGPPRKDWLKPPTIVDRGQRARRGRAVGLRVCEGFTGKIHTIHRKRQLCIRPWVVVPAAFCCISPVVSATSWVALYAMPPAGRTPLLNDDGAQQGTETIAVVQRQVQEVQTQMQENVAVMVENVERASNLETRSTELATQARAFHATSRQARRHMWWQLCKQRIFIGTACGGLLLIFILVIAGQAGAFSGGDDGEEATTLPSPSPPSL